MLLRGLTSPAVTAPLDLNLDHLSEAVSFDTTAGEQSGYGESSPNEEPVPKRHRLKSFYCIYRCFESLPLRLQVRTSTASPEFLVCLLFLACLLASWRWPCHA